MYKEPDYVTAYWAGLKMPKCCHTCDSFKREESFCTKFKLIPPEEFAAIRDACPDYSDEIPF